MFPPVIDLANYRRRREQQRRDPRLATVLRDPDPSDPNCSHYLIFHEDCSAVQMAIDGVLAEVDSFGNGEGKFFGPSRRGEFYFAVGQVVVRPDVIQEFWK